MKFNIRTYISFLNLSTATYDTWVLGGIGVLFSMFLILLAWNGVLFYRVSTATTPRIEPAQMRSVDSEVTDILKRLDARAQTFNAMVQGVPDTAADEQVDETPDEQ